MLLNVEHALMLIAIVRYLFESGFPEEPFQI
jgi:hypothetical protein